MPSTSTKSKSTNSNDSGFVTDDFRRRVKEGMARRKREEADQKARRTSRNSKRRA